MDRAFRLLLLDVDGTVTESRAGSLPSPAVAAAVKQAQEHVHVALATGRALPKAKSIADALQLRGPSVINGGTELVEFPSGRIIRRHPMPAASVREIIRLMQPFGYDLIADNGALIKSPDFPADDVARIIVRAIELHRLPAVLAELSAVAGTAGHPTTSWSSGPVVDVHITHEHATKRHGVERLIDRLKLHRGQVIAIGDSHNDLPLLEAAGTKVVMGDAPDEVKAVADYVAPTLANDGVAHAIAKYILGR